MPKVTKIQPQVKQRGRYSVFVDEQYCFSLSESALIASGVYTGQELTRQQLIEYKEASKVDKAYIRLLSYVARRARSEGELRDYMQRKGYDEQVTDELIVRLRSLGLADDEAFAELWVKNRRLLKPVSKRRLIQELRQKRIADDIIEKVLHEDEADEHEVLRSLVVRRRQQNKYQDEQKLIQYLVRQGFSYGDIKTVLADITNE